MCADTHNTLLDGHYHRDGIDFCFFTSRLCITRNAIQCLSGAVWGWKALLGGEIKPIEKHGGAKGKNAATFRHWQVAKKWFWKLNNNQICKRAERAVTKSQKPSNDTMHLPLMLRNVFLHDYRRDTDLDMSGDIEICDTLKTLVFISCCFANVVFYRNLFR